MQNATYDCENSTSAISSERDHFTLLVITANFILVIIASISVLTVDILEAEPLHVAVGAMAIGLDILLIEVAIGLQRRTRVATVFKAQQEQLIAELRHEKERAVEAKAKAEEASKAKSQFLAAMSHELRTPLNAIMGFSDILRYGMFGAHGVEAYKTYAEDIHASGKHLLTLVNDILDLSRIEAGRHELHEEPLSLAISVEEAVRSIELQISEKNIRLALDLGKPLPRLMADRRALQQIWLNLLTNAVKFTPNGGEIEVTAERIADDGLAIRVRDSGPGVPPHEMEAVMGAFARGSYAIRKGIEGAGLGLSIVKGLVVLHGGSFALTNRATGGMEATVIFPEHRVLGEPRGEVLTAPTATMSQRKLIAITC